MSKHAATAYTVGSATRRCAATGRELCTGEKFVAALAQSLETGGGGEEFVRVDFGEQAWSGGARPEKGLMLLGFWRGVVAEAGAKRKLLIDDESLLDLFEQTGEESAEAGQAEREVFRFVLALILLRKRLLVQEGSKEGGVGGVMLVRQRGVPRMPEGPAYIEVVEPKMDDAALARVTQQLSAVLTGETAGGAAPGGGV